MSADVEKATHSLRHGSTFGGETDLIFDGSTVRALSSDEKKAVEASREATKAGAKLAKGDVTDALFEHVGGVGGVVTEGSEKKSSKK